MITRATVLALGCSAFVFGCSAEQTPADEQQEIIENLKEYVTLYQRQNAGALPASMDLIYDYMQDAGETSWAATPAMNVSTKNIDPVVVTSPVQRTVATAASEPLPAPSPVTPPKKTTTRRP